MRDEDKTKGDLISELTKLRQSVSELEDLKSELQGSEQRYRAVVDNVEVGISLLNCNLEIVEVNNALKRYFPHVRPACGQICYEHYSDPPRSEPCSYCPCVLTLQDGEVHEANIETRAGSKIRNYHLVSSPVKDWHGRVQYVIELAEDITERKKAQEAVDRANQEWGRTFNAISDLIMVLDSQHKILRANKAMADALGMTEPELIGKLCFELVHGDKTPPVSCPHSQLLADGEEHSERVMEPRLGGIYAVRVSPLSDQNGQVIGSLHVARDTAEREKAEAAIRQQRDFLQQLIDAIPTPIFYKDRDGRYMGCNTAFESDTGVPRANIVGKTVFEVASPDLAQIYYEQDLSLLRNPGVQQGETRRRDAAGNMHEVMFTKATFSDLDGGVAGMVGVILDITERKKAEEERETLRDQLLQAQKIESIGTLTGGIAHDFNNLLTIINGYMELILSEKTEDDASYSDLQKVLETGRKGAELIDRLLAFSKKGESNPQPLDLNRTVENSSKLMERTSPKMIEIVTILEKDLAMVNGDAAQVEQVLMNLCINAKEAMPDGGRLRIETKNVTVDEAYCRLHVGAKPGPHVLIEVADTGTGMDAETLGRIFDPFFTTKGWDFRKGTGLGLSVAKGIVERHGGWITCHSEPGMGTTFTVYFPVIKDSPAFKKPEPSVETVPGGGGILLVDDEELVRDFGTRILERAGYTVVTASNGREALEIYAREQSNIGLIVLDLIMPQMGGEKCLEELVKINPHVRVIVSTGHSLDARQRLHVGSLARGFVNKPYEMKQLVQTVREVLDAE